MCRRKSLAASMVDLEACSVIFHAEQLVLCGGYLGISKHNEEDSKKIDIAIALLNVTMCVFATTTALLFTTFALKTTNWMGKQISGLSFPRLFCDCLFSRILALFLAGYLVHVQK